jgi:hypothetical protein
MQKWEYKVWTYTHPSSGSGIKDVLKASVGKDLWTNEDIATELNELGRQGWEVVGRIGETTRQQGENSRWQAIWPAILLLKRPIEG